MRSLQSRFRPSLVLALLTLLLGPLTWSSGLAGVPAQGRAGVEILYLANEGFLLTLGDGSGGPGDRIRVLVDGLFRPAVRGYPVLSAGEREGLEVGEGIYGEIDLILATHHHGDHFSADAVARYLRAEPGARFLSTPQAVRQLEGRGDFGARVEAILPPPGERLTRTWPDAGPGGLRVTVFNLDHGPSTDAENLGFLIELGGMKFLHVGDTELTPGDLAPLGLAREGIDVAFLPTWHLLGGSRFGGWPEAVGARTVVAMHLPAADAPSSYFHPAETLAGLRKALKEHNPGLHLPPPEPGPVVVDSQAVEQ